MQKVVLSLHFGLKL